MDTLIFLAIWTLFIILIMRFGCGAHIVKHWRSGGHSDGTQTGGTDNLTWAPPGNAADPVCGKTVATDDAKTSVHAGNVHYFCSRKCREVFEAAPDVYVGGDDANHPKLEHSHV
jgi:YHS domain-containing protein